MIKILDKINNHTFPETHLFHGESCALIGNSATLLDNTYGKEIDSMDFIIRSNQARVIGYESFVGTRTDLRLMNIHSFASYNGDQNNYNENSKFFSKFSQNIFLELNEKNYLATNNSDINKAKSDFHKSNFFKVTNETNQFIEHLISGHATTGFVGIILALKYFKYITLYGFDFYEGANDHYFENTIKYDRSEVHSITNEKNIINTLQLNNIINLK